MFTRLVTEGREALGRGDTGHAAALLTEALDLYRGQPLADVPRSELVAAEVDRLEECRVVALGLRARPRSSAGGLTACSPSCSG